MRVVLVAYIHSYICTHVKAGAVSDLPERLDRYVDVIFNRAMQSGQENRETSPVVMKKVIPISMDSKALKNRGQNSTTLQAREGSPTMRAVAKTHTVSDNDGLAKEVTPTNLRLGDRSWFIFKPGHPVREWCRSVALNGDRRNRFFNTIIVLCIVSVDASCACTLSLYRPPSSNHRFYNHPGIGHTIYTSTKYDHFARTIRNGTR